MAKKNVTKNKSISGGTLYSTDSDHILATAHDLYDEQRECYVEDYNFGVLTINNNAPDSNGNFTLPVPPAQVQADWEETDSASPSYIKGKPTIPESIDVNNFLPITGGTMIEKGKDAGIIYSQYILPSIPEGRTGSQSHIAQQLGDNKFQYNQLYTNVARLGYVNIYGGSFTEGSWPMIRFYKTQGLYQNDGVTATKYDQEISDVSIIATGGSLKFENLSSSYTLNHPNKQELSYDSDRASGSKYYSEIGGVKVYIDQPNYPNYPYDLNYHGTTKMDPQYLKYDQQGNLNYETTDPAMRPFLEKYNNLTIDSAKGDIRFQKLWNIGNASTYVGNIKFDSTLLRLRAEGIIETSAKDIHLEPSGLAIKYSGDAFIKTNTTFSSDDDFKNNSIFQVTDCNQITLNTTDNISTGRIATFIAGNDITFSYKNSGNASGYTTLVLPRYKSITFIHSRYGGLQGWYPIGGIGGVQTVNNVAPDANGNVTVDSGKIDNISIKNTNVTISNKTAQLPTVTITAWDESSDNTTTFSFVGQKNS